MKNFYFLIFFSIICRFGYTQPPKVTYILNSKIEFVDKLKYEKSEDIIYLRTPFGSEKITNPLEYYKARNKVIKKIEIVFTTFKSTMTFQQKELNKKRLFSLHQLDPSLLKNDMIRWKIIGQTDCNSVSEGNGYFHGFKITFQPPVIVATEISYVSGVLNGNITEDRDTTIATIFHRNKNWNKMLIIADFTSSMYPFSAEMLDLFQHTIKIKSDKILYFTFFNDGDTKPPHQKPIGNTGGVYHCKAQDFEKVKQLAFITMQNGVGGKDVPENNIEAILKGIDRSQDCEDVIMMADNFASPKDMILLSKVTKPVKIIICGYYGIINPDYLNLARETNGSIHIYNQDIVGLNKLKEGHRIKIDDQTYKIVNGKFRIVY